MSNKLEHFEFKLEKILGFRNMQEKLENILYIMKKYCQGGSFQKVKS